MTAPSLDSTETVAAFEALRPYLFAVAYRMLGSATDAEDVVQDAYLRYHAAPRDDVRSPKAFLTTLVTRLCLDRLKSARAQREQYVGPWLPEPVPTADADPGPLTAVERREAVSLAFLVLLERLAPEERAAYVLREAFDYGYDEIAGVLGKTPAASRQLVHRARERVATGRPRFAASPDEQRLLTERFLAASERGDLASLTAVLASDVVSWSDGGAKAKAARLPIPGRERVARFLAGLLRQAPARGIRAEPIELNGGAALLLWTGDALHGVLALDGRDGLIEELRFIINPDKLAYLRRRLDQGAARGA